MAKMKSRESPPLDLQDFSVCQVPLYWTCVPGTPVLRIPTLGPAIFRTRVEGSGSAVWDSGFRV